MRFDIVDSEELDEEADGAGEGNRGGGTEGTRLAFSFRALSRDAWNSYTLISTDDTSISANAPSFCLMVAQPRRLKTP